MEYHTNNNVNTYKRIYVISGYFNMWRHIDPNLLGVGILLAYSMINIWGSTTILCFCKKKTKKEFSDSADVRRHVSNS